jgi:hypothetical protein
MQGGIAIMPSVPPRFPHVRDEPRPQTRLKSTPNVTFTTTPSVLTLPNTISNKFPDTHYLNVEKFIGSAAHGGRLA